MYLVKYFQPKEEQEMLQEIFTWLNQNGDSRLSREELLAGYTKVFGHSERAQAEVERMMERSDMDHNGFIDYSGM